MSKERKPHHPKLIAPLRPGGFVCGNKKIFFPDSFGLGFKGESQGYSQSW